MMYEFVNARHFALFVGVEAKRHDMTHDEFVKKYIDDMHLGEHISMTNALIGFRSEDTHRIGFFEENDKLIMLLVNDGMDGVYGAEINAFNFVSRWYPEASINGPFEKWRPEIEIPKIKYTPALYHKVAPAYDATVPISPRPIPCNLFERMDKNAEG